MLVSNALLVSLIIAHTLKDDLHDLIEYLGTEQRLRVRCSHRTIYLTNMDIHVDTSLLLIP
jgi:hypothetical protein